MAIDDNQDQPTAEGGPEIEQHIEGVGAVEPKESPEAAAPEANPHAASKALLDSITDPDPNAPAPDAAEKPEGEPGPSATADPATDPKKTPPQTPDQEEAALLDGVKSERGKERIKSMLGEKRQLQSDLTEFREMVVGTGMSPDQFAQTLEFGRLINSSAEQDKRTALAMLDSARADLVKELGIDAPGVDPLADFADLSKAVENMDITREHALEIARSRRKEAVALDQQKSQKLAAQSAQQYQSQIDQVSQTASAYFATREKEADYPVKMKQIQAHFADPKNVQEFVTTFQPNQWLTYFRIMYDNIKVAPVARQPQPLRSRPANMGVPRVNGEMDNQARIMSHLDSMGI